MAINSEQSGAVAGTYRPTLVTPPVRIGLSRTESAEYIGVGVSLFDQMVADGRMPRPKLINSRKVWHRMKLDEAFAALPEEDRADDSTNDWDLD